MKNKPNEENSTIKQALLDLKASGGDAESIDLLISQIEQNHNLRENADKLFQSHQYPEHSLNWFKLQGDIEFPRFLSPNALTILIALCQNMQTDNLLQISHRDLINITHLSSLKAVQPAMRELVQNGCITEIIEASGRRSAVYMVNPEIATVGKKKPHLTYLFWKKVRDSLFKHDIPDDDDGLEEEKNIDWKDYPKSTIRDKWMSLTKERTYSKGTEYWKEGSHGIRYNKIKKLEPKEETEAEAFLEKNARKRTCPESTEQNNCGSRIIQFNKATESRRKRKAEPNTYLEDDDISKLPF